MKRNRFLIFLFYLLSAGSLCSAQDVIKILAIGNSFSQDAVEQYLYELADAEGIRIVIDNMFIAGCSLERHLDNAHDDVAAYSYRKIGVDGHKKVRRDVSLKDALTDEEWDYVSLQQASSLSGIFDTYAASLPNLVKYVRLYLPEKTTLMLHQTWAYAANSTHTGFNNYDKNQLTMYQAIVNAVKKAGKLAKIKFIIPSGTAIQNARTSFVGDHLTRDGFHLDLSIGRYTAACTWFERIFGVDVTENSYCPKGMSYEYCEIARLAAHNAVKRPFKITELSD